MKFDEAFKQASTHTIMNKEHLGVIWNEALMCSFEYGQAMELGVRAGGSSLLICRALPHKTVYMFDTFAGLPGEKIQEFERCSEIYEGRFRVSKDEVENYLVQNEVKNYQLCPGIFPESLKDVPEHQSLTFTFVHLDCDLYATMLDALEYVYPRMSANGTIVVHDYGLDSCKGCKPAIDKFFANKPEKVEVHQLHQCVIRMGNK